MKRIVQEIKRHAWSMHEACMKHASKPLKHKFRLYLAVACNTSTIATIELTKLEFHQATRITCMENTQIQYSLFLYCIIHQPWSLGALKATSRGLGLARFMVHSPQEPQSWWSGSLVDTKLIERTNTQTVASRSMSKIQLEPLDLIIISKWAWFEIWRRGWLQLHPCIHGNTAIRHALYTCITSSRDHGFCSGYERASDYLREEGHTAAPF